MYQFTLPVRQLIEELKKIPGIGRKSAQRICFYLMKTENQRAEKLAKAILQAREQVFFCSICHNLTATEPCEICSDDKRDRTKICVVEEPFNIYSIESTNLFKGLYHVLHGNLSPMKGIGPDELKIAGLPKRVEKGQVKEVILATSPTTEGNATAHYLTDILRNYQIKLSRIALGLPIGADMDYVDSITIAKAIEGRIEI
jgi:recombination protein RecR